MTVVTTTLHGQQVALVLRGTVYQDTFYGRALSDQGWQAVSIPFTEYCRILHR